MTPEWPIQRTEDLLAHAIAIEREAAARYTELGERMGELGNDTVAELFLRLARLEKEHEQAPNRELSELAAEMAAEEGVHIAWVKSALRRTPDPVIDWNSIFG